MKPSRKLALLVLLAFVTGTALPSAALTTSPDVVIRTLAGSGAAGFADGTPGSFLMPFGVAYGPDGTLYVTDAGAQRIRAVDPSGRVRTLAGGGAPVPNGLWVHGGYRDGTGADARFDRPAGIVWLHDRLYIADTNNHCIRVLSPDGGVQTYAGSQAEAGTQDGPVAVARFSRPTGLAKDAAGNLYVADFFGIRVIHDGVVRTLAGFGSTPFGVAVADTADGPVIFAADLLGLVRRDAAGNVNRYANPDASGKGTSNIQGVEPLGYPFSVAAFDANSVIYGDVRGNAIRYLNMDAGAEQVLGGRDVYDGAASTAGSHDGRGDESSFNGPTGLAIATDGSIAIADAGSRRIRVLTKLDRTHDAHPAGAIPTPSHAANTFRVAFIGNSYLWVYDRWEDSIPGLVEQRLSRDPSFLASKKRLAVTPFVFPGAPVAAQANWINGVLGRTNAADLVIFSVTTLSINGMPGVPTRPTSADIISGEPQWTAVVTESLRATNDALSKQGIRLIVVTSPVPDNVSPAEWMWRQLLSAGGQTDPTSSIGDALNAAVRASGVSYLDGWSVFETESRSAQHTALFGTEDEHFSPHGRTVFANALADYLSRIKPWSK